MKRMGERSRGEGREKFRKLMTKNVNICKKVKKKRIL